MKEETMKAKEIKSWHINLGEHTATPWIKQYVATQDGKGGTKRFFVCGGSDHSIIVATLKGWDGDDEANAAFIVQAVNAHDELVEALKEIAEGRGRFDFDHLKHCANTVDNMKDLALKALAKAEGK